jgi:hypothetical protein
VPPSNHTSHRTHLRAVPCPAPRAGKWIIRLAATGPASQTAWSSRSWLQVLLFGCAYWRIADGSCSATTLGRRRDEWIEAGEMDALEEIARQAYDRAIGLDLSDVAVDRRLTKVPGGGEKAGRNPVDRGKGGLKRSAMVDACGIPLGAMAAPGEPPRLTATSTYPGCSANVGRAARAGEGTPRSGLRLGPHSPAFARTRA